VISLATKSDRGVVAQGSERSSELLPRRSTTSSGDHELMRRVACGEAAALECLLNAHWQPVLRYANYLIDSPDAAEDVVQEAFVRLWARSPEWRPRGCVRAFLYRVTRNLVLNERRRERVRTLWARHAEADTHWYPMPTHALEAQEIHAALKEAVAALPDRRRKVFWLARYQQMTHHEIAEVMGISVQTVANQMSAALATLRERLRPYCD
jgi:RNA polymerase sigma-70 factor (family 1)